LPPARRGFEEVGSRHLKDFTDLLQAARANPVGAPLVFLNLLEGEPEMPAENFAGS
jgi:hypothetical protein